MYKTALPYCSFVEKTPFMGVELLDLLENYNCVSYNRDSASKSLIKRGFKIIPYQDKKIIKPIDSDRAVIEILKNKKFVKNNIKLDDTGGLLLFYMDSEINDLVKENDLNLLLPQYNLQQLLGDKLQVSFLTEQLNLPAYKSLNYSSTSKNQKKDFVACAENLGLSFIVQGEQGVSGEDTRLIHEEDEFINFSKKNKRFKASYYVKKSISISMQICITSNELIIRGPFPQILGFKELSSNLYQYSGGDLNQQIISKKIIEDAIEYSKKITDFFQKEGYLGIFGIDYLWDLETDNCYLQEINSRLVGLTRLLTGVQKKQKVVPDLVKHINTFLPDKSRYLLAGYSSHDENHVNFLEGSQLYIANNLEKKVVVKKSLHPGIYKIKNNALKKQNDSLFMKDLHDNEILVTLSADKNNLVVPNGTLARILLNKSVLQNNKYLLTENTKEIISIIKKHMLEQL